MNMFAPPFTAEQREWILARDGHRCQFHTFDRKKGKWIRCPRTDHLQVHHIIPRSWASKHFPPEFIAKELNGPYNLITLCASHHVGTNSNGECIHPDTREALKQYRSGDKTAYLKMRQFRDEKTNIGLPYWHTLWDWLLNRIAKKTTGKMTTPYPEPKRNGSRNGNGRGNDKVKRGNGTALK